MVSQATKQRTKSSDQDSQLVEMRAELTRKIPAHTQVAGELPTAGPGLLLYRRTTPTACYPGAYEPSLNVFVQGRKRVNLGGMTYLCDESTSKRRKKLIPPQLPKYAGDHAPWFPVPEVSFAIS